MEQMESGGINVTSKVNSGDELRGHSQMAACTTTGSESGELRLYPAALTALTLNTQFTPVVRPWHTNLKIAWIRM